MTTTEIVGTPSGADELPRRERQERTRALFATLIATADPVSRDALRERIARLNMCVAESVAHRYRGRGESQEDLEQVAYLGLVKAVNGFDSAYHKDFLTYAVPTISGELKKHFRDHCWAVRPPRRVQELQQRIGFAREQLSQEEEHQPTSAELAKSLGVDECQVVEALSADGCFTPSSLDVGAGETGSTAVGDLIGDDDPEFDEAEARVVLGPVVRELGERDRDVIELRFFHDWTQQQIADELGVTQMQVSRIIARVLTCLRERIGQPVPTG